MLWSRFLSLKEQYIAWRYEQIPKRKYGLTVVEFDGRVVAERRAYGMH